MSRILFAFALWILGAAPAYALDVWMSTPANGAIYTAPATIFVQAQAEPIDDGERVSTHRLYQNGAEIASGAKTVSATVTLPAGQYQFRSQATNNRGQTTSSNWVNVTVVPPTNQNPAVSMNAPTGAPFIAPAVIGLSASPSDPDGWITEVQFFRDGVMLNYDLTAPFESSFSAPSAGTYNFWAVAIDNNGARTTSATVPVSVAANAPPTIAITSPANNANFITPTTISIAATASDSDGYITRVDFVANGQFLGSDTTAPYQMSWYTGTLGGLRTISATAYDNKGGTGFAAVGVGLNSPTGDISVSPHPCTIPSGTSCQVTISWTSNDPNAQVRRLFSHWVLTGEGIWEYQDELRVMATGANGSFPVALDTSQENLEFQLWVGGAEFDTVIPVINYPPTATINVPSNDQIFHAPAVVAISASANDSDGTVSKVEFYANGGLIATDATAPYDFVWSNAAPGQYKIDAIAYDNWGAVRTPTSMWSSVNVLINARPTVALTSPADNGVINSVQSVTLSASASDQDGIVTKVDYYADGALIGTSTSAPFSASWTPSTFRTYQITAVAYDNRGASASSTPRSFTLNAPPTVRVTGPVSGKAFAAPANITLSATAADANGTVSKVEFWAGSTLLGTATGAPFNVAWTGVGVGRYLVTAKATDNHGVTTTSKPIALTVMPAGAISRRFVYDGNRQLCKTIEPETGATAYAYDGAGNLAWSASGLDLPDTGSCDAPNAYASGRRVDRTYTARNRLETLSFPNSNGNQVWTYTPDGLPSQVTTLNDQGASQVVNAFSYNHRRLPTGESQAQTGRSTWSMGYGYSLNGHLASDVYPDGLTIDYAPNAFGQATQAGPYASGVTYYPNGAIRQFTYGNGITHTMVRNERGLPERSLDSDGVTAVLDDSYDYDFNGNVAAISDGLPGNRGNRSMTYDGLDRLKTASSSMFGTNPLIQFTYDGVDNIKRVVGRGKDLTYVYDARNRLTNVTETVGGATVVGLGYDVQGNLQNKNGQAYSFDTGNRLRNVTGKESYRYDSAGRRVMANAYAGPGPIWSLYSMSGALRMQQDERTGQYHDYVYLAGSLVAKRTTTAFAGGAISSTYQHTDALGTPVAVTDEQRAVIERSEYDPYGALLNRPLTDGPGFTGHMADAMTGMTYMQQRYYDPAIGRFLSVDPVAANSATGANFNRYKYASNNPYKFTDPDGRADLNMFYSGEKHGLFFNAARDADMPGYFTIGGHANEQFFSNQKDGAGDDQSFANDVLGYARSNGLARGQPMFLLSCETGLPNMGAPSLGQQMADANQSRVLAPNGFVNYDRKGDTTTLTVWSEMGKKGKQGGWQSFSPDGKGATGGIVINRVAINHETGSVTVYYAQPKTGTHIRSETFSKKEKVE